MNQATYKLEFRGDQRPDLTVGDMLHVTLTATVRRITADLVDITSMGREPLFTLGDITVDLVANTATIEVEE